MYMDTVHYIQKRKSSDKFFEVGISFKAVHKVPQDLVTQYVLLLKNEESKRKLQYESTNVATELPRFILGF